LQAFFNLPEPNQAAFVHTFTLSLSTEFNTKSPTAPQDIQKLIKKASAAV
jgi:hypothetical protein